MELWFLDVSPDRNAGNKNAAQHPGAASTVANAAGGSFVPVRDMAAALRVPGASIAHAPEATAGPDGFGGRRDVAPQPGFDARDLDVTAARLAREITGSSRRVIGLLPAGPSTDALTLAEPLSRAVVTLVARFAIVLDPERRTAPREAPEGGAALARALAPGVVLVAPKTDTAPGAKAEGIKALLGFAAQQTEAWRVLFVDLSGCTLPGEILDVLPLVDGVLVVGRAGHATASELTRATARVPEELRLGVVLAD